MPIFRRRVLIAALNLTSYAGLLLGAGWVFFSGGPAWLAMVQLACVAVAAPWTVLGFWNGIIGLWLLHGRRDALAQIAPYAAAGDDPTPITLRTAVLLTIRNEAPARALHRLQLVRQSLAETGQAAAFTYFVLSDTSDPAIAAEEEAAMAAWRAAGIRDVIYRRRPVNTGYKAGNLRDFIARWGDDFALMLPLDADSLMDGPTILRLVRMMQADPGIGILQSLVTGLPSASAFARIFQFGMRHGMRSYTMGQAWWTADCGPFWGHNALVRIAPFRDHCALPELPRGPILSHDQVEAVLMRRAGFTVRVLPVEGGSWEENPPTLPDYVARDLRWCQGNLQYFPLLRLPGLKPVSRFQLLWAIAMFIGIPAWTLFILLLPVAAWLAPAAAAYPGGAALGLYIGFLLMFLTPKLAGIADTLLTPGGAAAYGGAGRLLAGAGIEAIFGFLQGAAGSLHTSLFMLGLLFGRRAGWRGQRRDAARVGWGEALGGLWPHALVGVLVLGPLAWLSPATALWSLPITAGYLLAIPFAVLTASPAAARWLARTGLCAIPEDLAPPPLVAALAHPTC